MKNDTILIVCNRSKAGAEQLSQDISSFFSDKAVTCLDANQLEESQSKLCVDLAFSIGGDGTVLTCCRALSDCESTPIIAIKMGTFGYMTEVDAAHWKDVYKQYIEGIIGLSERRMLTASLSRSGCCFEPFSDALNDIVISGSGGARIVKLNMFINGCFGGAIRSDGVIVASPTGSTAYSMAAGGPILDPEMNAMIITPVCPFSLSNRPIVIGGDSSVEFQVLEDQRTGVSLNADGQVEKMLVEGDRIRIESTKRALFVNPQKRRFIEVIRDKLHWDGGFHA
ncbi:MAG: NAD(+)/NADH kinase [Sphaerochaetaceae bacterium]|nr:NAD(+)/NADH kinase [Sphaerochaetaceae bacterium]MDD3163096.1 NAD(+)/NADH kinase [Sphaerochaetaceae bacterium]MDD4007352.1 NAD(+)/NADH kinase [Sphaerochaetaceae bacterium]